MARVIGPRINPRTTSAARAAEILYERYGQRAEVEASNRYDRAETGATADFYDRVLTALGRRARVQTDTAADKIYWDAHDDERGQEMADIARLQEYAASTVATAVDSWEGDFPNVTDAVNGYLAAASEEYALREIGLSAIYDMHELWFWRAARAAAAAHGIDAA